MFNERSCAVRTRAFAAEQLGFCFACPTCCCRNSYHSVRQRQRLLLLRQIVPILLPLVSLINSRQLPHCMLCFYSYVHRFKDRFLPMSHETTISTSQADHRGALYRSLLERSDRHHTVKRSSSTNTLPGTLPTHRIQGSFCSGKSTLHICSRLGQPELQRKNSIVPPAGQPTALQGAAPTPGASSNVSIASLVRERSNIRRPSPPTHLVQGPSATPKPPGSGIVWNRIQPGDVWFARPTRRNGQSLRQSSESPTSSRQFLRSDRRSISTPPKPLRPPPSRSNATIGSGYHREVKLETSFTASAAPQPAPQTTPRRRRFLNPRQIFSNTVLRACRFTLRSRSHKHEKEALPVPLDHSDQSLSPVHTLNHSTALRPNKTSTVLQRVTSILCETEAQISPHNAGVPKAVLKNSTLLPLAAENPPWQAASAVDASAGPTVLTPTVSYTSSQRELRFGAAPAGTPEDNATYKVGGEIFFKVDISIRGGTSYLPSEARRIHTPPLPGKDLYVQGPLGPDGRRIVKMKPRQETAGGVDGMRPLHLQRPRGWYDIQLQLLESEVKPVQNLDVRIDYDIPEHLPSSPLCPRNDQYWRYARGKLKPGEERHLVCWMHGMRDD